MMQQALVELASRMLAEARDSARIAIEGWQRALETVADMERTAGCRLVAGDQGTPANLAEAVRLLASIDYEGVLGLARTAREASRWIMDAADARIRQELADRQANEKAARTELDAAARHVAMARTSAFDRHRAQLSAISWEKDTALSAPVGSATRFLGWGALLGVSLLASAITCLSKWHDLNHVPRQLSMVCLVFLPLGFALFGPTIAYRLRVRRAEALAMRKAEAAVDERDKAIEDLDAQAEVSTPELQQRVVEAEERRRKVEAALQLLVAQR